MYNYSHCIKFGGIVSILVKIGVLGTYLKVKPINYE